MTKIEEIISTAKETTGGLLYSLESYVPIIDSVGDYIGTMIPLSSSACNNPKIYTTMAAWRKKHMEWFLTYFKATPKKTQKWLNEVYLPDKNKLLFLLYTYPATKPIGHYGFISASGKHATLDNGLRGRSGGAKGFMHYMEIAFLSWLFGTLGMETVNLWVVSHNEAVQRWHLSVGYSYGKVRKLSKILTPDKKVQLLIDSDEGEPVDFQYLEFVHSREALIEKHPWVTDVYPFCRQAGKN